MGGEAVLRKTWMFMGSITLLMSCLIPSAHADSLSQKQKQLSNLQNKASQTAHQITAAKAKAQSLQVSINQNKTKIAAVSSEITTERNQLIQLTKQLQQLSNEITASQQKLQADTNKLKTILRAQVEDGNVPYLDVLFNSASFSDFLSRMELLTRVASAEKSLLNQVQDLQGQLKTEQAKQESNYSAIAAKSMQLQALQQQYLNLEHQQELSLSSTNQNLSFAEKQRGILESQIKLTKNQIRQIQLATLEAEAKMKNQAYLGQAEASLKSVNASALISYAESFVGLPYIWGGTTPSPGFDCSGFTQFVFAHFGVYIARDTWSQFAEGVPVHRNNLQPGDVVFFSTYAPGASHVGIYVGNDMMVDSEDAGLIVTPLFSDPYWASRYIGARRYIK